MGVNEVEGEQSRKRSRRRGLLLALTALAMALALVACGGDDDAATNGDAANRACDGFDAVDEATKTGDEQAIRDGFEDMLTAANESGDDELTSLVDDLRAADGDAAFALALLDLSDYCDQLDA